MKPDRALVIFAKAPRPGRVKTRLCPPLTPRQAADLYRAFLADLLDEVGGLQDVRIWLAFYPAAARRDFRRLVPDKIRLLPQEGRELGARMAAAFERLFRDGAAKVCVIGSDQPLVCRSHVREAFRALNGSDVVLGPTQDGGYFLVALRSLAPGLFQGVAWSTARVWRQTLTRVKRAGLNVHALKASLDVDRPRDLRALVRALRDPRVRRRLPETRRVLRALGWSA